jgi:C_GCAxxG_C_C family probable redox protein
MPNETPMNRIENAVSRFKEGFSCSQANLSTFGEQFGLDRDTALKLAAGFGGGMGRMAGTCGAVTGAFMILGLKYGAVSPEDMQAKELTYEKVREFAARFSERNGSLECRELLGYDISSPVGSQIVKDKELISTLCPKYVWDAAEILEGMLRDDRFMKIRIA